MSKSSFAFVSILVVALGACQSTGGPSVGLTTPPDLPAGYRERAVGHLVSEYVRDATGPAEISEPKTASGIAGASSSVLVRYPVRTHSLGQRIIARGALLDRMERTEAGIRCVTVSAHHSIETGGATKFSISRPREDGSSCGEGRTVRA
jgi:hypothetical protein